MSISSVLFTSIRENKNRISDCNISLKLKNQIFFEKIKQRMMVVK